MLFNSDKALILVAAVLAIVFVAAVIAAPRFGISNKSATSPTEVANTSSSGAIENAFVPNSGYPAPGQYQPGQKAAAPPPVFQPDFSFLKSVENAVVPAPSSPNAVVIPNNLLPLPGISSAELNIGTGGAGNALSFFRYLALNYQKADFDYQKLNQLLQAGDKNYPSIFELIDRTASASGNSSSTLDNLAVFRDLVSAKMNFEKQIKVTGPGVETAKTVIALDELALTAIDNTNKLIQGEMARNTFDDFYGKYKNTAEYHNQSFASEAGLSLNENGGGNVFSKILGWLGVVNVARAQLPLGGLVAWQTVCTCEAMGAITVTTPGVPGSYMLPPVFLLFPFFDPTVGHFVLGTFEPSPLPCLQLPFCAPDPTIPATEGIVIMLGTSE